jgi:signal transduction histidine kinase
VPEAIRQNFQELTAGQLFTACPAGLAVREEEGSWRWNPAAEDLLTRLVSGHSAAWGRWLEAAVTRLLTAGRVEEVLPARGPDRMAVRIRMAAMPQAGPLLVALEETGNGSDGQGDLAETVSTLSHELRTPLASMKSSLQLVTSGEAGPLEADQLRFLDMTLRNIDRLKRLVSDLLDVSRADCGQLNLHLQQIDAAAVVQEAVAGHGRTARDKGLQLECRLPEKPVPAVVDGDKLVQMVGNLVGNALKFTPSGGQVRVSLEVIAQGDRLRLEVRDNGPGMDPATAEMALEPFRRGASADRRQVPGSGLGLHITRRLAEAHGGALGLKTRPGQGTLVWVELPRRGGHGAAGPVDFG